MIPHLSTELRKVLPYRTFWVILSIFTGFLLLIFYNLSNITVNGQQVGGSTFEFPGIWQKLTYVASYFNLLLGILIVILVTDEYTFRTLRQQIIDGRSRGEVVLAKAALIIALGLAAALFVLLIGLFFGLTSSLDTSPSTIGQEVHLLGFYFLQTVGYMAVALLIGHLLRKGGLAIICFLVYIWIVEPLIHSRLPDTVDKYFPMKVFGSLTPMPQREMLEMLTGPSVILLPGQAALPAIAYTALIFFLAYGLLKVRDL